MNVSLIACLQVECPCRRHETEGVSMVLEGYGCAGVDVREIKQPQQLVLCVRFIEREVGGTQDEPSLLPGL